MSDNKPNDRQLDELSRLAAGDSLVTGSYSEQESALVAALPNDRSEFYRAALDLNRTFTSVRGKWYQLRSKKSPVVKPSRAFHVKRDVPAERAESVDIQVIDSGERQAVLGRDLHAFLEIRRDYTNWMKQMIGYGFTEGMDFELVKETAGHVGSPNLANARHNHILTLDMAKEISMIQRTERGKQARQYFIECERRYKSAQNLTGPELMARALVEADQTIKALEAKASELEPKAASWETFVEAGKDYSISEAAKILSRDPRINIGRNKLFQWMKVSGMIFRSRGRKEHWEAYQHHVAKGHLNHKMNQFRNVYTGELEQGDPTIQITAKGIHYIHKHMGGVDRSCLPKVEENAISA